METWTFIISAAALAVSLYTYFAHDRKLKQQEERLINSYQLKQLQEEEQANKKSRYPRGDFAEYQRTPDASNMEQWPGCSSEYSS